MKEALFYERIKGGKVACTLCPHQCHIAPGGYGICEVRKNKEGTLYSVNYGIVSSLHLDPIEKKPLYHFHPGKKILSIGSFGCNLQCSFCQNHEISQVHGERVASMESTDLESIVSEAAAIPGNLGLAYTYNEPTVFYEMMFELAQMIHARGMLNVMVTNGYISRTPLERLIPFMDAFNIDLKGFSDHFFHKYTGSRLAPVKESLQQVRASGKHLEVTHLVIPGLNDDTALFEEMVGWIATALGKDTVLHISRYFPRYRLSSPSTPRETLLNHYRIASEHLNKVYLGNVS